MHVHESALKHGVNAEDALRAAIACVATLALDDESSLRQLLLGFSTKGELLEVVVLTFDSAMKARPKYLDLLP